MSAPYRHVGVSAPRKDARDIVTGGALFLFDRTVPGMLFGAVVRSPHAHAEVTGVKADAALLVPGVRAVLTHADVPDWRAGTPRNLKVLDHVARYVGDPVALVAAETQAAAREAAALVEVEYKLFPAALTVEEALAQDAPAIHAECPGNVIPSGTLFFGPTSLTGVRTGDVEAGFAEADAVVSGEGAFANLPNPAAPEPPGAIALWEEPNRVTLHLSSQGIHQDKLILYYSFGRNVDVRVIGAPCGGSYGSKFMALQLALQASALSRATGRPVKLVLSKEEQLAAFTLRLESRLRATVGMRRDGTVTAIRGEWLVGTGAYSVTTQAQIAVGCGEAQLAVRCSNWDLTSKIVCSNRNPSGIVRGFGGQELKCALLPILSETMEKLGIDPFDFLRKNYLSPGDDFLWRDGRRYVYRGVDYKRAMDEGAARFGWRERWKGWLTPTAVSGPVRTGVGVGVHGNVDVGESVAEAHVRLDPQGSATLVTGATEHGTGQPTNLCRMVAQILQLPLERVNLSAPDTATTPFDFGPVGSRGTYAMGSAAVRGAEEALEKLLEKARKFFPPEAGELTTRDGWVRAADPKAKPVPWAKVIGVENTILGVGRFEPDFTLANCMMTFVETEVDTETGSVRLARVVNATDAGRIIDPPGITNQLNGCLGSAGIDGALMEETVFDPRTGRVMNANLVDYKWRTFAELPAMGHAILETPMETHRFRAIGVGEVATAPGPSALLMAVSNAIGVRLAEYPLTPAKILAALAGKEKS